MNFKCKHCGQDYEVDDVFPGQEAECAECGKDFVIESEEDCSLPIFFSPSISLLIPQPQSPTLTNHSKTLPERLPCSFGDRGKDFAIEPKAVCPLPDTSSQPISLLIPPTKSPNLKNHNKSSSEEMLCRDCGARLSLDAIICVNCGLNLNTGKKLTTNYEKDEVFESDTRHIGASENMSDFKFNCPHCQQHLEAPEEMRGTVIDCPSCSGKIQIAEHSAENNKIKYRMKAVDKQGKAQRINLMAKCSSCSDDIVEIKEVVECQHIQRMVNNKDEVLAKNEWEIALCKRCLIKRHKDNLIIERVGYILGPIFFIIGGALFLFLNQMVYYAPHLESLRYVISIIIILAIIYGILSTPYAIYKLIIIHKYLAKTDYNNLYNNLSFDEKMEAIQTEGIRILDCIKSKKTDYYGTFSLPQGEPKKPKEGTPITLHEIRRYWWRSQPS